ncbi:MAG: secondary thiamine-phosphate synthase enzyme YjbQ [Pseudomonadota bacterium]
MPRFELMYRTTTGTDLLDVTDDVQGCVREAGVAEGLVACFVPGSTAALTTIEYESGALEDLQRALEQLAPVDGRYAHNARWHDGNGYSHLRAALLGPSLSVPVAGGQLELGTWQQILLCDFDNKPRQRRLVVRVLGDPA